MAVVRRIAEEVFASRVVESPISFLWHLGEPLAVPIAFYEQAFAEIASAHAGCDKAYSHAIQTNGTLLTPAWVEFLARHRVGIGLSVDGPAFLHDRMRVTRNGRGTHQDVLRAIGLLKAAQVPFGAIAVVTDATLDHADAFFQFFVEQGIEDVAINIDEIEGVHRGSSHAGARAEIRYKAFLRRLLELCEAQPRALKIREVWTNLRAMTAEAPDPYNTMNQPGRILNFLASGDYSTFCPELVGTTTPRFGRLVMGNILQDRLDDLPEHPTFRAVHEEIERGVRRCEASCSHWRFCGGGSPSNKFFESGRFDVTETLTCRIHKKATVDVLLEFLEQRIALAGA